MTRLWVPYSGWQRLLVGLSLVLSLLAFIPACLFVLVMMVSSISGDTARLLGGLATWALIAVGGIGYAPALAMLAFLLVSQLLAPGIKWKDKLLLITIAACACASLLWVVRSFRGVHRLF